MTEPIPASFSNGAYDAERRFVRWKLGASMFGAIAMALGALSGCFGLLTPLAMIYAPRHDALPAPRRPSVISELIIFAAFSVSLLWWGGGSLRQKRWVRPFALITASIILFYGLLLVAGIAIALPVIISESAAAGISTHSMLWAFILSTWVFFGIILPAAFLLFFKSQKTKEMLEYYDPVPRWTDRRPILLLGMVVWLALAGGTTLLGITEGTSPLYGNALRHPAAMTLTLVIGLMELALALLAYQLNPVAWWGTLVYLLIYGVRAVFSAFHPYVPPINPTTADQHLISNILQKSVFRIGLCLIVPTQFAFFGCLFLVRRYFAEQPEVDQPPTPPLDAQS